MVALKLISRSVRARGDMGEKGAAWQRFGDNAKSHIDGQHGFQVFDIGVEALTVDDQYRLGKPGPFQCLLHRSEVIGLCRAHACAPKRLAR